MSYTPPLVSPDLFIVDARSECPLGTLSLLTCDYAAGLVSYSLHVLTPNFQKFPPLLIAHGPLSSFDD